MTARALKTETLRLTEENGALREENEMLREAVIQLKEAMAPHAEMPRAWGLTPNETTLLLALRRASPGVLTKEQCIIAIYGVIDLEIPDPKIIDVFICKIRSKLAKAHVDFKIETIWGRGYRLDSLNKRLLNAQIEAEEARDLQVPAMPPIGAAA